MDDDPLLRQRVLGEQARNAHLRWLLDALEVDCVLDVGANRGQFGVTLRELGYVGRVVSFEPAAGPRRRLEEVAADDDQWLVRPWALGDTEEAATLHALDDESELGSLRPASAFGRSWKQAMATTREETVEVRRLDAVWTDVVGDCRRVLLKLDTQGYDLPAFRGAGNHVRGLLREETGVVALLSEVACLPIYDGVPLMAEHLAVYADAGWSPAGLYPVSFDRTNLRVIEFDALLVRNTPERSS